ncbi:MAG: hypothetical protein HZA54_18845 [Planctomycetes bacterium]|nr:hypothetical protein [Planctomycetota bacterium]
MPLWDRLFGRKQDPSLLELELVKREEKRLELREAQLVAQIEKLEGEKETVFAAGAKTTSLPRRRMYARRFGDLVARLALSDRDLARGSKELLTLGRIRGALERKATPLGSVLAGMSERQAVELARLLEDDRLSEELYLTKLDGLLGLADDPAYEAAPVGGPGQDVLKAWEAMDEVSDADLAAPPASVSKKRERRAGEVVRPS